MAILEQVETAVSTQLTAVNSFITDNLTTVQTFLTDLQKLAETLQIPYSLFTPNQFVPKAIDLKVTEPGRPDLTVADLPTLTLFTPDNVAVKDIPDIAIDIPPVDISGLIKFTEPALDPTIAQLITTVQNRLANAPDIDLSAAWERMRERDDKKNTESVLKISSRFAALGYNRMPGAMAKQIRSIYMDYDDKKLDQSRDVAYKEAELLFRDRELTLTSAIQMAGIMLAHADRVADRALTAARSVVEFTLAQYNAMVLRYNALVSAIRVQADVNIANANVKVAINNMKLQSYLGNISTIRTQAELVFEKLRTLTQVYGIDISKFNATLGMKEAQARIDLGQQELALKDLETNKQLIVQQALSNLQAFIQILNVKTGAATAGGHIWANAVAGAYNSINTLVNLTDSKQNIVSG